MQNNVPTLSMVPTLMKVRPAVLYRGQDHHGRAFTVVGFDAAFDSFSSLVVTLSAQGPAPVYCINLQGVDLITPSVASSLLVAIARIKLLVKATPVLTGVERTVLQGLCDMHACLRQDFAVWAMELLAMSAKPAEVSSFFRRTALCAFCSSGS